MVGIHFPHNFRVRGKHNSTRVCVKVLEQCFILCSEFFLFAQLVFPYQVVNGPFWSISEDALCVSTSCTQKNSNISTRRKYPAFATNR